ncbi:MAG TPA: flagellar basal body P-ring formation chaperone FlgA [Bryobacteraceae bacterium]|nr:flagellar basal body P-ring formation chaperone FlgA [Bryobacteraceae bacterium]
MSPLTSLAVAACLAVSARSDHITVKDVAPAFPGIDTGLFDQAVGLAPAPGIQRIFRLPELRRLATRLNVSTEPITELCFERPIAPLAVERVRETLHRQLPDATIEVLEYSRLAVPEGELEFPLSGLHPLPSGGLWSGSVRYGVIHRFSVWARVKISTIESRVVATEDLKPGQVIDETKVRLEKREEFPAANIFVTAIEQAVGKVLERPAAAGTPLRSQWLAAPKDIARGDTVQVEVWSGRAHLKLPAVAEASGFVGQNIPVRNQDSKKRFWAVVVGKGQVSVGKEGQ